MGGTGSYYENPRLASFLGRVNYVYDDRYVATVNIRPMLHQGRTQPSLGLFPIAFCGLDSE